MFRFMNVISRQHFVFICHVYEKSFLWYSEIFHFFTVTCLSRYFLTVDERSLLFVEVENGHGFGPKKKERSTVINQKWFLKYFPPLTL